jgi:hypothetical protein
VAAAAGPTAVRVTALVLLLTASALIAFAPGTPYRWVSLTGLGAALAPGLVALRASAARRSAVPWASPPSMCCSCCSARATVV